jgi:dl-methionine transporter subunit ; ATP-binding component of ABC superfamily
MISITNLNKSFGDLQVLDDINLSIEDKVIYGLVGESGQGKSTLLRCVNGLIPYDAGSLTVDGIEVKQNKGRDLRVFRKNIGMIFQSFSLLDSLTVYENIAYPMRLWKYNDSEIKKQVNFMLEIVDLKDKVASYPKELSGGQKQRVAIARALVMKPKYILSDESTSALDPKTAQSILGLLKEINREMGITILVVTHQMEVVRQVCDKMALLKNGKIEINGEVKDVFLQQPLSLQNLIGTEKIHISEGRIGLRLFIENKEIYQNFFSNVSNNIQINCNFLSGGIEKFKKREAFLGTIEIENEDFSILEKYLSANNISYEVIQNEI